MCSAAWAQASAAAFNRVAFQRQLEIGIAAIYFREEGGIQMAEQGRVGCIAHRQEIV